MIEATCFFDCKDKLGEGIIWDAAGQVLWWVDVPMPSLIHRLSPATGAHESWTMPEFVTALSRRRDGRLMVASHHGLNIFDPADGSLKRVAAPEADRPGNRSNDGNTDAAGRFWFGTMMNNIGPGNADLDITASTGSLYRVGADMVPVPMDGGFGISNATCFAPDGRTMYFGDTMANSIYAYDFDLGLGAISNRRVFSNIKGHGGPDGACVDAEGHLWSARWGAGEVIRFAPDGTIERIVKVPTSLVTCCTFGGEDLGTLYITTARLGLSEAEQAAQPQAGSLFSCRPGVTGQPPTQFAD